MPGPSWSCPQLGGCCLARVLCRHRFVGDFHGHVVGVPGIQLTKKMQNAATAPFATHALGGMGVGTGGGMGRGSGRGKSRGKSRCSSGSMNSHLIHLPAATSRSSSITEY